MVVNPEECPVPEDLTVTGCEDAVVVDMGEVSLESLGRIIQLDVTIKDVCPNKRVALAAILTEVDENGMEYQRGMKAMTIPAHTFPHLPGCAGQVHQIRRAGGSGRVWRFSPGHVQRPQLQGPVHRPQHRHRFPLLRVCGNGVSTGRACPFPTAPRRWYIGTWFFWEGNTPPKGQESWGPSAVIPVPSFWSPPPRRPG